MVDLSDADICNVIRAERKAAAAEERERCAAIVKAARIGTIDGDLRSLIHRIESGSPAPQEE